MASGDGNPWKVATFALVGLLVGGLATAGFMSLRHSTPATPSEEAPAPIVGATATDGAPEVPATHEGGTAAPAPAESPVPETNTSAPRPTPPHGTATSASTRSQHAQARPAAADIETCNRYASSTRDKARNALEKAVVGGVLGAAVGAAGGAIADGGSGAGKGAGIGGLVGAAAGTAYGINQTNQADARAEAAYRDCMQRRGYTSYARY